MKLAKVGSGLLAGFLLLSLVMVGAMPSDADASSGLEVTKASSVVTSAGLEYLNTNSVVAAAKPSNLASAKTPPEVYIIEPSQGAEVTGTEVVIQATATDDNGIKKVEYAIDGADWTSMSNAGGDIYDATWDSTAVADGSHTITVRATDTRNAKGQASIMVTTSNGVEPPPQPPADTYELFVEIDYLVGHEPTQAVLDYIIEYYYGNNPSGDLIDVEFTIDDEISLTGNGYDANNGINDDEFWAIESLNNDSNDGVVFNSKNKWVLYGTSVEDSPGTMGYCYISTSGKDLLAGNYIYIADESTDSWEIIHGVTDSGAEATVLMHELGHSIGIAKMNPVFGEQYDPDSYSVMSYLSTDNATQYYTWYYSNSYWDTRNLEYYIAS